MEVTAVQLKSLTDRCIQSEMFFELIEAISWEEPKVLHHVGYCKRYIKTSP
jgi:hypothetical protein